MAISRREFLKKVGVATGSLAAASVIPSAVLTGCASTGTGAAAGAVHRGDSPIFQPTKIGSLELKNKMFRAAMLERRNDENGSPTPALLSFYEEDAAGGMAMLTTGMIYAYGDRPSPNVTKFNDASQIPAYKETADIVHVNDSTICASISTVGSYDNPWAPASLSKEDIRERTAALAQTSAWLQEAGYDAIQLHFGGIYLINSFLDPVRNTRTDEYGGSVENRARFAFEALEAVRGAVGKDFPLIVKINSNAHSFREGGDPEETKYLLQGFADRGLNAVEVSGSPTITNILSREDQNYYSRTARSFAKLADIPLILSGGIRNVDMMEEALKHNGNIVALGMARTLMREPDLPLKWQNDTSYEPRCISCNWCLDHVWDEGNKTHCQFVPDRV